MVNTSINSSNPYRTINVNIHTGNYAVDNQFNAFLQQSIRKGGLLVDFTGHLHESSHCVSLRNFGIQNGKTPRHDVKLAQSTQMEINSMGVIVPKDFYKNHIDVLIGAYVMTGLGYCSVRTKDKDSANGFLCTKNISIIKLLCERYNTEFPQKTAMKLQERFYITEEELNGNYLNAVKITVAKGSLKLSSCRVHPHSKATTLVPMFVMGVFNDSVVRALHNGLYEVHFKNGLESDSLVTSLNMGMIAKYTRLDPQYVRDTVYSPDDMGVLRMFDFNQGEFVSVRLIDLIGIKKVR